MHLGAITFYLSEVVGHYLNTLYLIRNTTNKGTITVVMYLTFIVDLEKRGGGANKPRGWEHFSRINRRGARL